MRERTAGVTNPQRSHTLRIITAIPINVSCCLCDQFSWERGYPEVRRRTNGPILLLLS